MAVINKESRKELWDNGRDIVSTVQDLVCIVQNPVNMTLADIDYLKKAFNNCSKRFNEEFIDRLEFELLLAMAEEGK